MAIIANWMGIYLWFLRCGASSLKESRALKSYLAPGRRCQSNLAVECTLFMFVLPYHCFHERRFSKQRSRDYHHKIEHGNKKVHYVLKGLKWHCESRVASFVLDIFSHETKRRIRITDSSEKGGGMWYAASHSISWSIYRLQKNIKVAYAGKRSLS